MSAVSHPKASPDGAIVGRDLELATIRRFLAQQQGRACLVLVGDAGIGKTTIWEAAIADASGHAVLSSRCSQSEANLSFASLSDLLDGLDLAAGGVVPEPQLQALEVALGRRVPTSPAGEPLNIAAGLLSLIRHLASAGPILVAIDDVQWLDTASAECVTFAARRLRGLPVRFLLTRQPGSTTAVERELQLVGVETLEIGGLSFGAIRSILADRLAVTPLRRDLRQISDTSQGNPLLAIELGRSLAETGAPAGGSVQSVPELVDNLFGARARQMTPQMRQALLAVSLSGGLTRAELTDVVGPLVVEDAITAGYLTIDRARLRPTHPMLSTIIRRDSSAEDRWQLHLELADAITDPTLRIRHLAMATSKPDAELAANVADASRAALERGDLAVGLELADHAVRLTPSDDPDFPHRLLTLARCYAMEGDGAGVVEVLAGRLDQLPPGRDRVLAHMVLGDISTLWDEEDHLEQALAEAADDPSLQALVLSRQAILLLLNCVERIERGERLAQRAIEADLAGRVAEPTRVDPRIAMSLAWARVLAGRPIDDLIDVVDSSSAGMTLFDAAIERPLGVSLAFRGEIAAARSVFEELRQRAEQRGEIRFGLVADIQMCELELRCGRIDEATPYLEQIADWTGRERVGPTQVRLSAMRDAVKGDVAGVRRNTADLLPASNPELAPAWDWLETKRAVGLADLLEDRPVEAAAHFTAVWEHTVREGIGDPGAFPVAPDLVLALIQSGDLGAAEKVLDRLDTLSQAQAHPWGLATAQRCSGMLTLAAKYNSSAVEAMLGAAERYCELGLEFDQGRTLLCLGGFQRRYNKRADARRSLEQAKAVFEAIGATGWCDATQSELGRVSGRRAETEDLTVSERQVADLAAGGMSNKEIATALFVSVYTVEAHLSHAYAKLGIRSRAQLASRLRSD